MYIVSLKEFIFIFIIFSNCTAAPSNDELPIDLSIPKPSREPQPGSTFNQGEPVRRTPHYIPHPGNFGSVPQSIASTSTFHVGHPYFTYYVVSPQGDLIPHEIHSLNFPERNTFQNFPITNLELPPPHFRGPSTSTGPAQQLGPNEPPFRVNYAPIKIASFEHGDITQQIYPHRNLVGASHMMPPTVRQSQVNIPFHAQGGIYYYRPATTPESLVAPSTSQSISRERQQMVNLLSNERTSFSEHESKRTSGNLIPAYNIFRPSEPNTPPLYLTKYEKFQMKIKQLENKIKYDRSTSLNAPFNPAHSHETRRDKLEKNITHIPTVSYESSPSTSAQFPGVRSLQQIDIMLPQQRDQNDKHRLITGNIFESYTNPHLSSSGPGGINIPSRSDTEPGPSKRPKFNQVVQVDSNDGKLTVSLEEKLSSRSPKQEQTLISNPSRKRPLESHPSPETPDTSSPSPITQSLKPSSPSITQPLKSSPPPTTQPLTLDLSPTQPLTPNLSPTQPFASTSTESKHLHSHSAEIGHTDHRIKQKSKFFLIAQQIDSVKLFQYSGSTKYLGISNTGLLMFRDRFSPDLITANNPSWAFFLTRHDELHAINVLTNEMEKVCLSFCETRLSTKRFKEKWTPVKFKEFGFHITGRRHLLTIDNEVLHTFCGNDKDEFFLSLKPISGRCGKFHLLMTFC